MLKIAGSTYSCVAAPIQYAALAAYLPDDRVEAHVRDCTRVNATVGRRLAALFNAQEGAATVEPGGAFYLYVDFSALRRQFLQLGFKTCTEFARHLLLVEHTAILPGSALLLADDDFSARCSYVDYDGDAALAALRANPPQTAEDEAEFVHTHCPLLIQGVGHLGNYLRQVSQGKMPVHM